MVKLVCDKNRYVMGIDRVAIKFKANEVVDVDDNNGRYLTTYYDDIKYYTTEPNIDTDIQNENIKTYTTEPNIDTDIQKKNKKKNEASTDND